MARTSADIRKRRARGRLSLLATAIAVCALFGVQVSSAAAAPVTYTFDHGRVDFGIFKNVVLLPAPANVAGQPNAEVRSVWTGDATSNGSGTTNLTFAPADVKFPLMQVNTPLGNPPVQFTATGAATGSVNEATGATTINLPLAITAIVDEVEVAPGTFAPVTCTIAPVNLTLNSNSANMPFPGTDFSGGLGVNGAVSASWTELPQGVQGGAPAPPGACDQLNGAITGKGGIWLANTLTAPVTPPPPPPPPTAGKAKLKLVVKPKARRVKAGKKVVFRARVKNRGDATARRARVCVKAPKRLVRVKRCVRVGALKAGKAKTVRFRVRVKGKAKPGKKANLRFVATAKKAKNARAKARIRVR